MSNDPLEPIKNLDLAGKFPPWITDDQRKAMLQAARDMISSDFVVSTEEAVRRLKEAIIAIDFSGITRMMVDINKVMRNLLREWKQDRRKNRHFRMTHGKHGLKRPR